MRDPRTLALSLVYIARNARPRRTLREPRALVKPLGALAVTSCAAAYLAARLFVFPGVPVLLRGDQGFFWMYASRMLRGELPYRDFFQFTPPGADLGYLAAFAVLGSHVWVANLVVLLLGVGHAFVTFRVARDVTTPWAAALASALVVVLVVGQALSGTHHTWSVLAVLAAVAVLGPGITPARLRTAGAFVGVAAFCTQTHGGVTLVAIVAWLLQRRDPARLRHVAAFCLGFVIALALGFGYFFARIGPEPLWSCLVVYVGRSMCEPRLDLGLPEALTARSVAWLAPYLAVYLLVPLGLAGPFWRRREDDRGRRDHVRLIQLVGGSLFAEVLFNLSWVRLFAVAAPGIILFAATLERFSKTRRWPFPVAWGVLAALGLMFLRSTYRQHREVAELPAGLVATDAAYGAELAFLARHREASGTMFAASRQSFYLPLQLRNPLFLDGAVPGGQTNAELTSRALHELAALSVAQVLWSPTLVDTPGPSGADAGGAIGLYLHAHYRLVQTFANGDEDWSRVPSAATLAR